MSACRSATLITLEGDTRGRTVFQAVRHGIVGSPRSNGNTSHLVDVAIALLDEMYPAEGLIPATPVYYEDVSGQTKLFIDRNWFNNCHEIWLKAKSIGLIAPVSTRPSIRWTSCCAATRTGRWTW